jgi:hypothetical protein
MKDSVRRDALAGALLFMLGAVAVGFAILWLTDRVNPRYLVTFSAGDLAIALGLASVLYLAGAWVVTSFSRAPQGLSLFTAAFSLRVVVAIALAVLLQFDDERSFHDFGINPEYGLFVWESGLGYYNVMAILYAIFGSNFLVPRILNALVGALLPFLVYGLSMALSGDTRVSRRALLLAAFLPQLVVYSGVNLKEIHTAFLLALTLWCLVQRSWSLGRRLVGAGAAVVILYWLRGVPWTLAALLVGVTFLATGHEVVWRAKSRVASAARILALLGIATYVFLPFVLTPLVEMVTTRMTQDQYYIERFTASRATVMRFVDPADVMSPWSLGVLFLRGVFAPSPLRVVLDPGIPTVLEALGVAGWYIIVPLALVGFLGNRSRGVAWACCVGVCAVLMLTSLGVVVGADPYRQRTTALGIMVVLAASGMSREVLRAHRLAIALWCLGVVSFTALWLGFRL